MKLGILLNYLYCLQVFITLINSPIYTPDFSFPSQHAWVLGSYCVFSIQEVSKPIMSVNNEVNDSKPSPYGNKCALVL